MDRRQFTKQAGLVSAMVAASSIPGFSGILRPPSRQIKKGIFWGSIGYGISVIEKFRAVKAAV